MFNVCKSRRSGGLTPLLERVAFGPCGDSAAGAVPGIVNIVGPAIGFCGVCGDCCDGGIGDGRVGLRAVVVSEGRSSVKYFVTGCLAVTDKVERFRRSVLLLVPTRQG